MAIKSGGLLFSKTVDHTGPTTDDDEHQICAEDTGGNLGIDDILPAVILHRETTQESTLDHDYTAIGGGDQDATRKNREQTTLDGIVKNFFSSREHTLQGFQSIHFVQVLIGLRQRGGGDSEEDDMAHERLETGFHSFIPEAQ